MSMVAGLQAAITALNSHVDGIVIPAVPDQYEPGDLQWSARASKAKWLNCESTFIKNDIDG
jgi:hypothetical protein